MLRVDEEVTSELAPDDEGDFINCILNLLDHHKVDVVVFQDYNKGILTKDVITSVIEKANTLGVPTAVDPKLKNFKEYRNVTLFKPNLKEMREGLQMEIRLENNWEIENAANVIHRDQKVQIVFTTLSSKGVFISSFNSDNQPERYTIPAHVRSIADVSGAGDTVISVASLALACGMKPVDLATISNLAGGLVCEEVGVVPVNVEKFNEELKKLNLEK
jgi:rfaE bifunctional protein kinase chain/domain